MSTYIECFCWENIGLIVEWAIMELAKTLVFIGVLWWNLVGEPEEKEMEGLFWDKVEAGAFDFACVWFGLGGAVEGMSSLLYLFEPVNNWGMKLVLVSEVSLKVATGWECLRAKRAVVLLRELTEELMEVEVTKHRHDELAIFAVEEGKIAVVHPVIMECLGEILAQRGEW
jgi:hypothetical protein